MTGGKRREGRGGYKKTAEVNAREKKKVKRNEEGIVKKKKEREKRKEEKKQAKKKETARKQARKYKMITKHKGFDVIKREMREMRETQRANKVKLPNENRHTRAASLTDRKRTIVSFRRP